MRSEKSKQVNEADRFYGVVNLRKRPLLKTRPGSSNIAMTHAPSGIKKTKPSMAKFRAKQASQFKEELVEGKAPTHYHSIFYKHSSGKWHHHFDADHKEDAAEERRSLKDSGEKHVKVLRVPRHEANWHKRDVHDYVTSRLKEDLDETAPTNAMGGSSTASGPVQTYDPKMQLMRRRRRSNLLVNRVKGKYQARG